MISADTRLDSDLACPANAVTIAGAGVTLDLGGLAQNIGVPSDCSAPAALGIRDLTPGSGPQVSIGATVEVHYVLLTWSDRKTRESTFPGYRPFELGNVGNAQVIEGWNEGLIGAREGGRRLLVVPPDKGYPNGMGDIPPNETLVFVIDFVKVSGP